MNLRTFPHATVYKFSPRVWLCWYLYQLLWADWGFPVFVRVNCCRFPVLKCPVLLNSSHSQLMILLVAFLRKQKEGEENFPTSTTSFQLHLSFCGGSQALFNHPKLSLQRLSFPLLHYHLLLSAWLCPAACKHTVLLAALAWNKTSLAPGFSSSISPLLPVTAKITEDAFCSPALSPLFPFLLFFFYQVKLQFW